MFSEFKSIPVTATFATFVAISQASAPFPHPISSIFSPGLICSTKKSWYFVCYVLCVVHYRRQQQGSLAMGKDCCQD